MRLVASLLAVIWHAAKARRLARRMKSLQDDPEAWSKLSGQLRHTLDKVECDVLKGLY